MNGPRPAGHCRDQWKEAGFSLARVLCAALVLLLLVAVKAQAGACCSARHLFTFEIDPDQAGHFSGPHVMAMSSEGAHLYLGSTDPGALVVLSRREDDGELRMVQILRSVPASARAPAIESMAGIHSLVVSPDGKHVYAAVDGRLVSYGRDAGSGELTFQAQLAPGPDDAPFLGRDLLLAISHDGLTLYAGHSGTVFPSPTTAPGIHAFRRNTVTGALSLAQGVVQGEDGVDGLGNGVGSMVVSPSGDRVFAVSPFRNSLAVFARDPESGELDIERLFVEGIDGVTGLLGARWVSVDARGEHAYVAGVLNGNLAHFERVASPDRMEFARNVADPGITSRVTITPDGRRMLGFGSDALRLLSRHPATGTVVLAEQQRDEDGGVTTLDAAVGTLVSPDGRHAYVVTGELPYSPSDVPPPVLEAYRLADVEQQPAVLHSPASTPLPGAGLLALSPRGRNLYAAVGDPVARTQQGIAAFARDMGDGALTELPFASMPFFLPRRPIPSSDGKHLYIDVALVGGPTLLRGYGVVSRVRTSGALSYEDADVLYKSSGGVLSPDGRFFYVNINDLTILRTYRRNKGDGRLTLVRDIPRPTGSFFGSLLISADGRFLYDGNVVFRRRGDNGDLRAVGSIDSSFNSVLSADGRFFYRDSSEGGSRSIRLYSRNRKTGLTSFVASWSEGSHGIVDVGAGLAISPDGRQLVARGGDGSASVFSLEPRTGRLNFLQRIEQGDPGLEEEFLARDTVMSADHRHAYFSSPGAVVTMQRNDGPLLLGPGPGRILESGHVDFVLDANGNRVRTWRIDIGSAPGQRDIARRQVSGKLDTVRIDGLPVDGRTLYARVLHRTGPRGFRPLDTVMLTAADLPEPALLTPLSGEILEEGPVTFSWASNGHPVDRWSLSVGSTPGGRDLHHRKYRSDVTSVSVPRLPLDGRDLYVTFAFQLDGAFTERTRVLTAASPRPRLVDMGDGFAIASADQTFRWDSNGTDAEGWTLEVGSVPRADDLCASGPLPAPSRQYECTGLPVDGRPMHVTLSWVEGGDDASRSFQVNTIIPKPRFDSPAPGSVLGGRMVSFVLDRRNNPVRGWDLRFGTRPGRADLFRARLDGAVVNVPVDGLPTQGGSIFVRLGFDRGNGKEFVDYEYLAADFPAPQLSAPLATEPGPMTFRWTDNGHLVTRWELWLGTAPGGKDLFRERFDGATHEVTVPEALGDVPVYARLRFKRGKRFEHVDTVLQPHPDECCELTLLDVLYDDQDGIDGMFPPARVVISPDGRHVYVSSTFDRFIVSFTRDPVSGEMTFGEALDVGTVLGRGVGPVTALEMSRDGAFLYSGTSSDSQSVRVWRRDVASGALTFVEAKVHGAQGGGVEGLGAEANDFIVSADDRFLYVASGPSPAGVVVFRRDLTTGTLTHVQSLAGAAGSGLAGASGLALSPDGAHLYVSAEDDDSAAVLARDAATGELDLVQSVFDGVAGVDGLGRAAAVIVSPDGEQVYVLGTENKMAVFDRSPSVGTLTFRAAPLGIGGGSDFPALVFNDDGTELYLSGGTAIRIAPRDTDGMVRAEYERLIPSKGRVNGLVLAPLGATGSEREIIAVFRREALRGLDNSVARYPLPVIGGEGEPVQLLREGDGGVDGLRAATALVYSPDGRHVYVGAGEHKLAVFALSSEGRLEQLQVLRFDEPSLGGALANTRSLLVSPDGRFLYAGGYSESPIREARIDRFARDTGSGGLTFIDSLHLGRLSSFSGRETKLAMSPDGADVYVVDGQDDRLQMLERDPVDGSLTLVGELVQDEAGVAGLRRTRALAVSGDGLNVYVVATGESRDERDDTIATFARDPATGKLTFLQEIAGVPDGAARSVHEVVVSPDGRHVYATFDGDVVLFERDVVDGTLALVAGGQTGTAEPAGLSISSDGAHLYAGEQDLQAYARDAVTGALSASLAGDGTVIGSGAGITATLPLGDSRTVLALHDREDALSVWRAGPAMTQPTSGDVLPGRTVTFRWTANGVAVSRWRFALGSSPGASDLCRSRKLPPAARTHTCSDLPLDGSPVYATLEAGGGGAVTLVHAQYIAAAPAAAIRRVPGLSPSATTGILDGPGVRLLAGPWGAPVHTAARAAPGVRREPGAGAIAADIARVPLATRGRRHGEAPVPVCSLSRNQVAGDRAGGYRAVRHAGQCPVRAQLVGSADPPTTTG